MKAALRHVFVVMVLLFCSVFGQSAVAAHLSNSVTGQVTLTIGMGVSSIYDSSRKLPITIKATGDYARTENIVSLTIQTGESDYYGYEKYLEPGDNGDFVAEFSVYAAQGSLRLVTEILNEEGRVIYSRTSSYQRTELSLGTRLLVQAVGVMINTEAWGFTFTYNNSLYQAAAGQVAANALPCTKEGYEGSDLVVVSADTELSSPQKEALFAWQKSGGTLLLLGNISQAEAFGQQNTTEGAISTFSAQTQVSACSSDLGNYFLMDRQRFSDLSDHAACEALLEFMMEQKEDFGKTNRMLAENTLVSMLDQTDDQVPTANVHLYLTILLCYIVAALVIYLILRQKKKTGYYRLTVVVLSALTAGIIWFLGGVFTRFDSPFINALQYVQATDDQTYEQTIFSLQAPYNERYYVNFDRELSLSPVQSADTWKGASYTSYSQHTALISSLYEGSPLLIMDNLVAFSTRYFSLTAPVQKAALQLERVDGILFVKNLRKQDLFHVWICFDGKHYYADKLPADASMAISETLLSEEMDSSRLSESSLLPAYSAISAAAEEKPDALCLAAELSNVAGVQLRTDYPETSRGIFVAVMEELP